MISPEAKDWIHTAVEIATALGVWGMIGRGLRQGKRVGKAVSHAPELLHDHEEIGGETLTAAGVRYLEPRGLGPGQTERAGD